MIPNLILAYCRICLAVALSIGGATGASGQQATSDVYAGDNPDIVAIMQNGTNLLLLLENQSITDALVRGEKPEPLLLEERRLRNLLVDIGYLDAELVFEISNAGPDQSVRVLARVDPGLAYTVGAIHININGVVDPALTNALSDVSAFARDQVVNRPLLDQLSRRLMWQVGEAGYALAEMEPLTTVANQITGEIDVLASLNLGNTTSFAGANIERVPASLIERVRALQPFEPGDLYSSHLVDQFRASLGAIPNIRRAQVEIAPRSGGQFELVISVRLEAVTGFNDGNTELGMSVLMGTLLFIMFGLIFRNTRSTHERLGAFAFKITMLSLTTSSVILVISRAASLV